MTLFSPSELTEYRSDALDMLDYRCDVWRDDLRGESVGGYEAGRNLNPALLATNEPCFIFWPSRGPRRDEPDRQQVVALPRLYARHDIDLTERDLIGNVRDQLGGVIVAGRFEVMGVQRHGSHTEAILREVDASWGR